MAGYLFALAYASATLAICSARSSTTTATSASAGAWRASSTREHGIAVTLWVDDLGQLPRICPEVDRRRRMCSRSHGVTVRHWRGQDGEFAPADVADIVIEFFGVDIPPAYIAAMAQREPRPVWINYEGLSAEEWVEGCHPCRRRIRACR
jgi:hypothetical protein